ncbi:hypothetical protein ACVWWO_003032 [Bradyrhizobium sp. F1.13.1]
MPRWRRSDCANLQSGANTNLMFAPISRLAPTSIGTSCGKVRCGLFREVQMTKTDAKGVKTGTSGL